MNPSTKLDERFFESTRGRIVVMLRGVVCTVEELAGNLELTNNAVRAHLATLERDKLVLRKGVRKGFRKPHYTYTLSPEAEAVFPKAYDVLLIQLILVLKKRFSAEVLVDVLEEVGRSLAAGKSLAGHNLDEEDRAQTAVQALAHLGGKARVEHDGDKLFIRSESCPISVAVMAHPEVCKMAVAVIAYITDMVVIERCDKQGTPKCQFELSSKRPARASTNGQH